MKIFQKIKQKANEIIHDRNTIKQFICYVIAGASAVLVEFISFNLMMGITVDGNPFGNVALFLIPFVNWTVTGTNICQSVSMFLGTVCSYTLNRKWSFKTKNPIIPEMLRFGALFLVNLLITNVVIRFLQLTPMPDWMCKGAVQCMMVLWNFIIYRTIIFKPYNTKEKKTEEN